VSNCLDPESYIHHNCLQIIVSGNLIEDTKCEWASPINPVFKLTPNGCEEHIASIYMQLRSSEVCHYTFWDIHNKLWEAVDSEIIFQSCNGGLEPKEVHSSLDPNVKLQLPLHHLHACKSSVDGIPAGWTCEGEGDLIVPLSLALPEDTNELSEEEEIGTTTLVILYINTHIHSEVMLS
jgi:hypothetical protein